MNNDDLIKAVLGMFVAAIMFAAAVAYSAFVEGSENPYKYLNTRNGDTFGYLYNKKVYGSDVEQIGVIFEDTFIISTKTGRIMFILEGRKIYDKKGAFIGWISL